MADGLQPPPALTARLCLRRGGGILKPIRGLVDNQSGSSESCPCGKLALSVVGPLPGCVAGHTGRYVCSGTGPHGSPGAQAVVSGNVPPKGPGRLPCCPPAAATSELQDKGGGLQRFLALPLEDSSPGGHLEPRRALQGKQIDHHRRWVSHKGCEIPNPLQPACSVLHGHRSRSRRAASRPGHFLGTAMK